MSATFGGRHGGDKDDDGDKKLSPGQKNFQEMIDAGEQGKINNMTSSESKEANSLAGRKRGVAAGGARELITKLLSPKEKKSNAGNEGLEQSTDAKDKKHSPHEDYIIDHFIKTDNEYCLKLVPSYYNVDQERGEEDADVLTDELTHVNNVNLPIEAVFHYAVNVVNALDTEEDEDWNMWLHMNLLYRFMVHLEGIHPRNSFDTNFRERFKEYVQRGLDVSLEKLEMELRAELNKNDDK